MKKQLLAGAFVLASFFAAQAQTETHNFNDLNVGDLGTDITGEVVGQGGWITFGSNGAAGTTTNNISNSSLSIVANDEAHGNVLSITGPNGSLGSAVAIQNPGEFYANGANAGNTILSTQFDFFTGTPDAATKNFALATSYGVTGTSPNFTFYPVGGFAINLATLQVYGRAYLDASGTQAAGSYIIGLAETGTVTLPSNTWVTLAYSYNIDNGDLEFTGSANGEALFAGTFTGASSLTDGLVPEEVDFSIQNGAAGNTVAATGLFDNISFTAGGSILSTKSIVDAPKFAVYPNPANDVVNVSNADALVNNITVVDLNGRTVKALNFANVAEAQVNISDLSTGVYMMTISSDKGTTTKKIVKN